MNSDEITTLAELSLLSALATFVLIPSVLHHPTQKTLSPPLSATDSDIQFTVVTMGVVVNNTLSLI